MIEANDLWIFGYGSLMWRPDIPFVEHHIAEVSGYHRAFCVASTHHRGSEQRPGLVLGLDRGGACRGIVYRVPAKDRAETLAYLRQRELIYGVYREAYVAARILGPEPRLVRALAYIVERQHPSYEGRLPGHLQVRRIRQARGISGWNLDYLINTVNHLRAMGIREHRLERLVAVAAGPAKRGRPADMTRPGVAAMGRAWARHPVAARPLSKDQRRRFGHRWRLATGI